MTSPLRTTDALDEASVIEPADRNLQPFSSLLKMPYAEHRVSKICDDAKVCLKPLAHHLKMPYNDLYGPGLKKLGLYYVSRVGDIQIDKALISALVERWRPETCTFHLPVGEVTITLQDVGCLLGLPIDGHPITGVCENNWSSIIEEDLGKPCTDEIWKMKTRKKDGIRVVKYSRFRLRLRWLKDEFSEMPQNPTQDQIDQHTRAFVLYLLGSVLFPDSTGDGVPAMYLQFLRDLREPPKLNWGAAVLAVLYRSLSTASQTKTICIAGPLMLLQMWSWTRLNVSRPTPKDPFTSWGLPNLESCQPYGRYWTGALTFPNSPHNAGMGSPRDELDAILDECVNWLPYEECISLLPSVVQTDSEIWTAKIPLIHFWTVTMHYPDRVMRQFGLFQHIPPPDPLSWDIQCSLDKVTRLSAEGTNWAEKWEEYISPWEKPRELLVNEVRPYDITTKSAYLKWFGQFGMRTVFSGHYHVTSVDEPRPLPSDPVNSITYVQHGDKWTRQSFRAFKEAVLGINLIIRGMISVGKILLKSCRGNFIDLGQGDKFDHLLQEAGLPFDIDSIATDGETLSGIQTLQFTEEEYRALYNSEISLMDLMRRKETGQPSSSGSEFLGNNFTRDFAENEINVMNRRLGPAVLFDNDSRNRPICTQALPAMESLSANEPLLPSVVGQACKTTPALSSSPNKPVCWPEDDILTRVWVADFSNMLDWSSRNLPPQQLPDVLPASVIQKLVVTASNLLHREQNCIRVNPRADQTVIIVGDIHGQLHDAMFLLQAAGFPSESRIFVFNGDYVDRGSWGLETLALLLAWKSVFLLRGNHESKYCTSVYGFKNEVFTKYGDDARQIYQLILKCFQELPLASIIARCVYTAHGGLFRGTMNMPQKKHKRARNSSTVSYPLKLGSLEELSKARRNVFDPPWKGSNLIPGDILWSDPSLEMGLSLNEGRGGLGLLWGPDISEEFMLKNDLKLIVRSHEGPDARDEHIELSGMNNGFTIDHQVNSGKLITVFSAPDYPQFQASEERYNNLGAYIVLNAPDFTTPVFCCFEAVKPRPEAPAYYDFKEVMDSDKELDYSVMDCD